MNNPTREEFNRLEAEVRRLREQQTELIKMTRLEVEQKDLGVMLDNHTAFLQELDRKSEMHTQAFQRVETVLNVHTETISALQADVASIKATQSDHGEYLKSHGEMLRAILAKLEKGE